MYNFATTGVVNYKNRISVLMLSDVSLSDGLLESDGLESARSAISSLLTNILLRSPSSGSASVWFIFMFIIWDEVPLGGL